jgi:hypothetical protein
VNTAGVKGGCWIFLIIICSVVRPFDIIMKFGHNLPRNQVPEWSSNYINYKGLKKLIKSAASALKDGQEPDLAGPFSEYLI